MNSDRCDLSLLSAGGDFGSRPHACQAFDSFSGNSEVSACSDQNFLKPPNIFNCSQRLSASIASFDSAKVENRITHQLSWSMECDVAAAIRFEQFNVTFGQFHRRSQNVFLFRVSPQRDDGCVLQEKKDISDTVLFAQFHELLLEFERGLVILRAELKDGDHFRQLDSVFHLVDARYAQKSR